MRETGSVRIERETLYAYFTVDGQAARLRLSADECERLDLFAGRQVRVGLPGREPGLALVTAVESEPPFVWVGVEFAGTGRRAG